jgi:hypothetical protein
VQFSGALLTGTGIATASGALDFGAVLAGAGSLTAVGSVSGAITPPGHVTVYNVLASNANVQVTPVMQITGLPGAGGVTTVSNLSFGRVIVSGVPVGGVTVT